MSIFPTHSDRVGFEDILKPVSSRVGLICRVAGDILILLIVSECDLAGIENDRGLGTDRLGTLFRVGGAIAVE